MDLFEWIKETEERARHTPKTARQRRLEAEAATFHSENPHVYALFDKFTWQIIRAGFLNYSADAVFHRIRWFTHIETGDPTFKINNNHCAYYSRMWMENNPNHDGFFRTRELRNELIDV